MADHNDIFQPADPPPWLKSADEGDQPRQFAPNSSSSTSSHSRAAPVPGPPACFRSHKLVRKLAVRNLRRRSPT